MSPVGYDGAVLVKLCSREELSWIGFQWQVQTSPMFTNLSSGRILKINFKTKNTQNFHPVRQML